MPERMNQVIFVVRTMIDDITSLNWSAASYSNTYFPIMMGSVILVIVVTKILWRWIRKDRSSQKYSGYKVDQHYQRGVILRSIYLLPKIVIAFAIAALLVVLTEPFLNQIKNQGKVVESRIRTDLRDTSTSMEGIFPGTKITKAQVAVEAHLRFLEMRRGKNDRASFWLFASFPHLVEDFIVDDELYYNQAADSFWITGWDYYSLLNWLEEHPDFPIPFEKYGFLSGEGGGTNMVLALQAVIRQIDNDSKILQKTKAYNRYISRSVMMLTDAEVAEFPLNELEELRKRKVIPYIIWIRSDTNSNTPVPEFAKRINEYGGRYFDITNRDSLIKAYEEIDKLETVKVEIVRNSFKIPLFQIFLEVAILILFLAILIALALEQFGVYP